MDAYTNIIVSAPVASEQPCDLPVNNEDGGGPTNTSSCIVA